MLISYVFFLRGPHIPPFHKVGNSLQWLPEQSSSLEDFTVSEIHTYIEKKKKIFPDSRMFKVLVIVRWEAIGTQQFQKQASRLLIYLSQVKGKLPWFLGSHLLPAFWFGFFLSKQYMRPSFVSVSFISGRVSKEKGKVSLTKRCHRQE